MSQAQAPSLERRVFIVTSAKGGVGKTTVSAALASLLAAHEHRVLAIDLDLSNRCLDLLCGIQDLALYHIRDVAQGTPLSRAVVADPVQQNLFYLTAPMGGYTDRLPKDALCALLHTICSDTAYDRIVIDTPGAFDDVLLCAAAVADEAIVVSTAQQTALRSAQVTGFELAKQGLAKRSLLINCYPKAKPDLQSTAELIQYIDETALQLLGIVPFEKKLGILQNRGLLVTDDIYRKTHFRRAMERVTARLEGEHVPIGAKYRFPTPSDAIYDHREE